MALKTLLDDAIAAMDELLESFIAPDCDDQCIEILPEEWRKFVDAHARLLFEQKNAKTETCDEDVVEIFELLQQWHASKINQLKKVVDTPDDTEICLQVEGGATATLSEKEAAAFKAGVYLALELLQKFPLKIEASQPEEDEAA